jgi:hypothetical protein
MLQEETQSFLVPLHQTLGFRLNISMVCELCVGCPVGMPNDVGQGRRPEFSFDCHQWHGIAARIMPEWGAQNAIPGDESGNDGRSSE